MTAGRVLPHPLADLVTVMWHYVRRPTDGVPVGASWLEPEAFDAQLDAIAASRTVVDWPTVAEALDGGPPLPPDAALLTFDDGLADHARTVVPLLLRRGWSGVFFVLARAPGEPLTVGHAIHVLLADLGEDGLRAGVVDGLSAADGARFEAARGREVAAGTVGIDVLKRPLQRDLVDAVEPILHRLVADRIGPPGEVADALHLTPADLASMRRDRMTIGGHGRRHLWFDHAPPTTVTEEVAASAALVADGPGPWAFAYPYGASSVTAVTALADQGFAAAFHAGPRAAAGLFDLGRVDGEDEGFPAAIVPAARPDHVR